MVWYFRVVENEDRSWACRHGRVVFDEHLTLGDAIDHTDVLAAAHPPAEVMIHRLDGSVENLGAPPETGNQSGNFSASWAFVRGPQTSPDDHRYGRSPRRAHRA